MSVKFLEPPPFVFEQTAILRWLQSAWEAIGRTVVTTVAADCTLLAEEAGLVFCANTGAIAVTLPSASIVGAGTSYLFIKTTADAFAVTLTPNGSETINGAATNAEIDAQYDRIGIVSDGTNWLQTERFIS